MPLQPVFTSRFKKDVELAKRRGKGMDKLKPVIMLLLDQQRLEARYHDHWLSGNYKPGKTRIIFERTGTHSDLY